MEWGAGDPAAPEWEAATPGEVAQEWQAVTVAEAAREWEAPVRADPAQEWAAAAQADQTQDSSVAAQGRIVRERAIREHPAPVDSPENQDLSPVQNKGLDRILVKSHSPRRRSKVPAPAFACRLTSSSFSSL